MKPSVWLKNGERVFEVEAGSDLEKQLRKQGYEVAPAPAEDEPSGEGGSEQTGDTNESEALVDTSKENKPEPAPKPKRERKPKVEATKDQGDVTPAVVPPSTETPALPALPVKPEEAPVEVTSTEQSSGADVSGNEGA